MADDLLRIALDEAGVGYELLKHRRTETAADEAAALDVAPEEVAKTLVLTTREGHVRLLVPAARRIDLAKVREALGDGKHIRLATEEELERDYPQFELGAVPPVGGRRDPLLVDRRLAERESVLFEAGRHDESVWVRTSDLLELGKAQIGDLCEEEDRSR